VQPENEAGLAQICFAPNRAAVEAALDVFAEKYRVKCDNAVECLTKDRKSLLSFYDLPVSIGSICARRWMVRTKDLSANAKLIGVKLTIATSKLGGV
jgi:putative transposase